MDRPYNTRDYPADVGRKTANTMPYILQNNRKEDVLSYADKEVMTGKEAVLCIFNVPTSDGCDSFYEYKIFEL